MRRTWTAALIAAAAVFAAGYVTGEHRGLAGAPAAAETPDSKPAYMIVTGDVTDREAFLQGYAAELPALYQQFGGQYLAIGAEPVILEGGRDFGSFVVAEWPSVDAAMAFWNSAEYDALRRARIDGGWGAFEVFLVEGLARPSRVSPLVERADGK